MILLIVYFFLSISDLLNVESSSQPVRQSGPLAHFSFRTMRIPRVTQLPRHILPPVAPETGRCTYGPACPARETRTRNRPWCVSLLIPLQNVSLEPCEFRRARYDAREYLGDRFRSMRSVLTQKAGPTDSTRVELMLLIFTEPCRDVFKCKIFVAKYASIVIIVRCNNYFMNNLMHDIGSLSCANAIVCNTTDTVDQLSLSLRTFTFFALCRNIKTWHAQIQEQRVKPEFNIIRFIQLKSHPIVINYNTNCNINKMFLQNINSCYLFIYKLRSYLIFNKNLNII